MERFHVQHYSYNLYEMSRVSYEASFLLKGQLEQCLFFRVTT